MTMLPIADRWFELKRISDDITLLWEPHVVPLMRCNIWHVRGRDRDLMIDTGMGIASLRDAAQHLLHAGLCASSECLGTRLQPVFSVIRLAI